MATQNHGIGGTDLSFKSTAKAGHVGDAHRSGRLAAQDLGAARQPIKHSVNNAPLRDSGIARNAAVAPSTYLHE